MNYKKGQEKLLIIEPFYGGSHKKLIDIICASKYLFYFNILYFRAIVHNLRQ